MSIILNLITAGILPELLIHSLSKLKGLHLDADISEEGPLLDQEIEAQKARVLATHRVTPPVRITGMIFWRIYDFAFTTSARTFAILTRAFRVMFIFGARFGKLVMIGLGSFRK
jgi:hypothetical protein